MHTILEPEYSRMYEYMYGKQPKYVPTDLIDNRSVPNNIEVKSDLSRIWSKNPKYKAKK